MDLQAYFRRIGYIGSVRADREVLEEMVWLHATSIPFENLDVLAGLPISLQLVDVEQKLVARRRGGYCFEQHALLGAALSCIGFEVHCLSARVWYNNFDGTTPPRTHVFLRVDLHGQSYLVDCGVGGSSPSGLMNLNLVGVEQALPHETRRIIPVPDALVPTFMHQVKHENTWVDVYDFTGESMPLIDQEMGNWWTSAHPNSKFRKRLIIALLNRDGTRMSFVDRLFVHRRGAQILEQREATTIDEVLAILDQKFGLDASELLNRFQFNSRS